MSQNLRRVSPLFLLGFGVACATVTSDDDLLGSGGSGGSAVGTGGGTSSGGATTSGGSTASGGASTTGGAAGSAATGGTGGVPITGKCAEYGSTDEITEDDKKAVYSCPNNGQGACTGVTLNEPALFICGDDHLNNCTTQKPEDSEAWIFLSLCSDLGAGGAGGDTMM